MLNFGYVLAALALIALIPVFLSCCYLFILSLFSLVPRWQRLPETPAAKFGILLSAHNAEKVIEKVVADLVAKMDYPPELFEVIVVADNCSDSTSYLASFSGAQVIEFTNDWKQGRGYALEYAFKELRKKDFNAFLIADVNTVVGNQALKYLDSAITKGAKGMQLPYALMDGKSSWNKRYADILMTGINYLRRRGRSSLHLSCGIAGNGLCLTKELLAAVPFVNFVKAEGIEYHYKLVLADEKVIFVPDSGIYSDFLFPARKKEEAELHEECLKIFGKYQPLLLKAFLKGNFSALDCILDFYTPSLKTLFMGLIVIMFSGALLVTASAWRPDCDELLLVSLIISGLALLGMGMLLVYLLFGMLERRLPISSWLAFVCFPFYVIGQILFKFLVLFKSKSSKK